MTDTLQYAAVIVTEGAEFIGIQRLPEGNLILFTDTQYRNTLAVTEREFSREAVSLRLRENRRRFINLRAHVATRQRGREKSHGEF
jgi:hypothetical protein